MSGLRYPRSCTLSILWPSVGGKISIATSQTFLQMLGEKKLTHGMNFCQLLMNSMKFINRNCVALCGFPLMRQCQHGDQVKQLLVGFLTYLLLIGSLSHLVRYNY